MAVDLVMDAPSFVVPGRPFEVAIEVDVTDTPAEVHRITISAHGQVTGSTPGVWGLPALIDATHQVHHEGTLAIGRHRFVEQFEVASDAPPSFRAKHHGVRLGVSARVHRRGLAVDRSVQRELTIRRPVPGPIAPEPFEGTNRAYDDTLWAKLSSRRIGLGDTLEVELTGTKFDHDRPVEVDVKLAESHEAIESITGETERWYSCRQRVTIPAPDRSGARPAVMVSIAIPPALLPSFETYTLKHTWELRCHALGRLIERPDVVIPLEIVDVDTAAATVVTSRLSIDQRIEGQFSALVADGNWRRNDGEPDSVGLPAAVHDLQVGVRRAQLELGFAYAASGPTIVSRIRCPSLGVGLEVHPSTPWRERFSGDITASVGEWDRLYRVTASDEAAAQELLRAVVPELVRAEHLGSIARWTDDTLELTSATNDPPLALMAAQLERVAAAILARVPDGPHDGVYR